MPSDRPQLALGAGRNSDDPFRVNGHALAFDVELARAAQNDVHLLLAVVFVAFATSEITFIKMFGVGMALAVIMDATLIRGALVPAFMRLAGNANWWAPRPLRRLYERFGISDTDEARPAPVEPPLPISLPELSSPGSRGRRS